MSVLEHNRSHISKKPSWNKGLHTGNQYTKKNKAMETELNHDETKA